MKNAKLWPLLREFNKFKKMCVELGFNSKKNTGWSDSPSQFIGWYAHCLPMNKKTKESEELFSFLQENLEGLGSLFGVNYWPHRVAS